MIDEGTQEIMDFVHWQGANVRGTGAYTAVREDSEGIRNAVQGTKDAFQSHWQVI
jgi:hypothetical protein